MRPTARKAAYLDALAEALQIRAGQRTVTAPFTVPRCFSPPVEFRPGDLLLVEAVDRLVVAVTTAGELRARVRSDVLRRCSRT